VNKFTQKIYDKKIYTLSYLPRWIIFSIDIAIIIFANLLTYIMLVNLISVLSFYDVLNVYERYSLILIVNTLFFIVYRTYAGIIRHSSFIDAIKLFLSTFSSLMVLVLINYGSFFIFGKKIFLIPGLILSFVLSFTLLFFFRILVKFIFENFINTTNLKQLIPALVYGTDANAIAVANAIKSEIPARFKIVAFIDNTKSNKSKSILGLPILYNSKKTSVILRSYRANALIIAEKSLSKEEKLNIIDDCLAHNIKVFTVPIVTNWENEQEISKQIKSFEIEDLLDRKPIVLDNKLVSSQLSGNFLVLISNILGS